MHLYTIGKAINGKPQRHSSSPRWRLVGDARRPCRKEVGRQIRGLSKSIH